MSAREYLNGRRYSSPKNILSSKKTICFEQRLENLSLFPDIASMPALDLQNIEKRIGEMEAYYTRLLSLAGRPGYNYELTGLIKKDLDWLREQKANISGRQSTDEKKFSDY